MTAYTSTCRVELVDSMGNDVSVVNAARVSHAKHVAVMSERDVRLLRYLANATPMHWAPFAQVTIKLRLAMPIFVARQWMRSTVGCSRNETSRRYVDGQVEYFVPDVIRARPEKSIKQGSGGAHPSSRVWQIGMQKAFECLDEIYQAMIEDGVCPEQARTILPLAHMTEFVETGSLAYFARVCGLRSDGHAQGEIRDLAALVSAAVAPVAPLAWEALTC